MIKLSCCLTLIIQRTAEADRRRHASQPTSHHPEAPPALQINFPLPGAPPAPPTVSPRPGAPPAPQTTLPQPEVPPPKVPRVNLVLPEQPAQGDEGPDEGLPMDVDEAPPVSFHACLISGRFLTFKMSLSAAGGQRVPRMLSLKESERTCLGQ